MRGASVSDFGISDIPMQLLIGACLITFAAPIFMSAYGDLSEHLTDEMIREEIDGIMIAMEEVLSGEAGSRKVIDVDLIGFGSCNLEFLAIGGDNSEGSDVYLIRYDLSTGLSRHVSLDPPFPIWARDGGSFRIGPGEYTIGISRQNDDGRDHLEIWIEG